MDEFSSLTGQHSSLLDLSPTPAICGFMELLGNHRSFESLSSLLDGMSNQMITPNPSVISTSTNTSVVIAENSNCSSGLLEASEVSNQFPATPNSSSISSASNDDNNNLVKEEEQEDQDPNNKTCTKQPLKPRKTNQKKKQREARIAFMTKSEVDHLEDGYRWRKYGQKAVKNSSFPRSYYRCTSSACNVKKRVERCFHDPSIVITTYEGQHTHPSPIVAHALGFPARFLPNSGATLQQPQMSSNAPSNLSSYLLHDNYVNGFLPTSNFNQGISSSSTTTTTPPPIQSSFVQQGRRVCNPSGGGGDSLPRDNGLLQDIVPSNVYHNAQ